MKKRTLLLIFLLFGLIYANAQPDAHHFDHRYQQFQGRTDYYNWKVYLVAGPAFLSSVRQVVYYLDPTFSNSTRTVNADQRNPAFTLCCNGWGGFQLRIKIVFSNGKPDLYEKYNLVLTDPSKKDPQYSCNF